MKRRNTFKKSGFLFGFLLFVLSLAGTNGFGAAVDEGEAIAAADLWYAMELNSGYTKIDEAERAERLGSLQKRQLLYLVSKDNLQSSRPSNGRVLAYVIKYEPTGFVVVSGEDRIEPIIVFSIKSEFRWDQRERNFLRHFLGKTMPARWEWLRRKKAKGVQVDVHRNWSYLRSRLSGTKDLDGAAFEASEETIYVLWDTALWGQDWPYNETVVANNGGTAGIPTGCTATAMAIKMRFHEWPETGSGSHSYDDNDGDVQYSHSVNFGVQSYSWPVMPTGSLTSANSEVADLMYDCGVAVEMSYEVDGSGALPLASAFDTYFRYHGTIEKTSEHEEAMIRSIRGELPVVLSSTAHTVVADGYRITPSPYFHINAGWDGTDNGWYNLDEIPGDDPTIDKSLPYGSPDNYIYVDGVLRMFPTGSLGNAFRTISDGVSEVPSGGHLWIKAGTYTGTGNVPVSINKVITIRSYEGTAVIGGNLSLGTSGRIWIYNTGELKIY